MAIHGRERREMAKRKTTKVLPKTATAQSMAAAQREISGLTEGQEMKIVMTLTDTLRKSRKM